ncbi:hypothetical protein BaRGS_00001640 [Batillaria attramentaria]|uniref:Uncharacterized protein n=1 Tax=Batillaria attramentaria TaxID=370345 RepID=A0ABD0M872_9CAEN
MYDTCSSFPRPIIGPILARNAAPSPVRQQTSEMAPVRKSKTGDARQNFHSKLGTLLVRTHLACNNTPRLSRLLRLLLDRLRSLSTIHSIPVNCDQILKIHLHHVKPLSVSHCNNRKLRLFSEIFVRTGC